ncbi:hypothetical protein H6F43_00490 [Leptolyngbya sp. FACHB-36]|uniref:hypothetical protein n=1 Tax=Leptolyngbya sp. FACHB-36 TaxID=2692808 RepID=UPI00167FE529|nr:hypothetical protein [Leptolyngbya sp. FACHB-36]MBD2018661.1 hypothetical protein [Leptolyngbya sp. FACHB-36]
MIRPTLEEVIKRQADIVARIQERCDRTNLPEEARLLSAALKNHCTVLEILLRLQHGDRSNPAPMETRFRTYSPGATYATEEDDDE